MEMRDAGWAIGPDGKKHAAVQLDPRSKISDTHHLRALKRRKDFLDERIKRRPEDSAIDFFLAERAALDWAIARLSPAERTGQTTPCALGCWPDGNAEQSVAP